MLKANTKRRTGLFYDTIFRATFSIFISRIDSDFGHSRAASGFLQDLGIRCFRFRMHPLETKKNVFYEDENVPSGSAEGGYKAFPMNPPLEFNRYQVFLILYLLSKKTSVYLL